MPLAGCQAKCGLSSAIPHRLAKSSAEIFEVFAAKCDSDSNDGSTVAAQNCRRLFASFISTAGSCQQPIPVAPSSRKLASIVLAPITGRDVSKSTNRASSGSVCACEIDDPGGPNNVHRGSLTILNLSSRPEWTWTWNRASIITDPGRIRSQ